MSEFSINGSAIPEVPFSIGESYAGLLPIQANDTTNNLFFWFFPSTSPSALESKEILIWLTGGPGCSSIGELTQSNGPFVWQPGVFRPFANKWSWHHLTNVVWIDQPVGTGFSQGTVTATDEADVARQFLGFWKNFIDTFGMQGYKVYVTGSSYSGMYLPYISSAMLDRNNTNYYRLSGMLVFDGLYSQKALSTDIPVAPFVTQFKDIFAFNATFTTSLQASADQCGYTSYLRKYLVFPPTSSQPSTLPGQTPNSSTSCSLFLSVYSAAKDLNPCFSVYTISDKCPLIYDPLGFASGNFYTPDGAGPVFFDRPDVKSAINAPQNHTWQLCNTQSPVFVNDTDNSVDSQAQISHVIDATGNVILGHGSQDFVLIADGSLLTIQNLTWGGKLGFQQRPAGPLYIPYHDGNDNFTTLTGAGVMGTSHTERGLTYFGVPAGHFLTPNQPAVAFRAVEVLLGRVEGFQSKVPFSNDKSGTVQPGGDMGNGTVFMGFVEEGEGGEAGVSGKGGGVPIGTSGGGEGGSRGLGLSGWGLVVALGVVMFV